MPVFLATGQFPFEFVEVRVGEFHSTFLDGLEGDLAWQHFGNISEVLECFPMFRYVAR